MPALLLGKTIKSWKPETKPSKSIPGVRKCEKAEENISLLRRKNWIILFTLELYFHHMLLYFVKIPCWIKNVSQLLQTFSNFQKHYDWLFPLKVSNINFVHNFLSKSSIAFLCYQPFLATITPSLLLC